MKSNSKSSYLKYKKVSTNIKGDLLLDDNFLSNQTKDDSLSTEAVSFHIFFLSILRNLWHQKKFYSIEICFFFSANAFDYIRLQATYKQVVSMNNKYWMKWMKNIKHVKGHLSMSAAGKWLSLPNYDL